MAKFSIAIALVFALAFTFTTNNVVAAEADSIQLVSLDASSYHTVNGIEVRLAPKGQYAASSDGEVDFRLFAALFSMKYNMSEDEILRLNGWTKVADELMPKGYSFWVHPSLRPKDYIAKN